MDGGLSGKFEQSRPQPAAASAHGGSPSGRSLPGFLVQEQKVVQTLQGVLAIRILSAKNRLAPILQPQALSPG